MCHERLTINLGPQTNFIIGHNGSGKSAILTGILVALGGKASSTNRGNSLKSLVKEGKQAAQVTLEIKNKGDEAFKHSLYGDAIIIERRINADGGGSWRMKSAEGRTISTQRQELNAFCDHANIQVDNPMNVLTQDAARQFLSSSNPGEMYDFFLKGTQLKQLSEEYDVIFANIQRMRRTVEIKEEALPDLERAAREAASRYQMIEKQKGQHTRLQQLKNQVVWAQVVAKERDLEKAINDSERARLKKEKIQKEIARLTTALQAYNDQINETERRSLNDGNRTAPLTEERTKLRSELKELRAEIHKAKEEESEQSAQYSRLSRTAEDLTKRIEQETSKLAEGNRRKHMELELRHKALEEQRRQLAEQEAAHREALLDADPRVKELAQQEAQVTDERQRVRHRLEEQDALCSRLVDASRNSVAAFGAGVPDLVRAINQEGRWHRKPVGPIGTHLKLKDQKWAPVLESVIGNTLNAFCVTNHHDRKLLENLKRRVKCNQVPILTGSDEPFDFSQGEPPADIVTVLRVLDIDDDFVLRQLVNAVHIESSALVVRRSDGDQLMRSQIRNIRFCFSADMFQIKGGTVGSTTQTLNPYTGPPRLSTDVRGRLEDAQAAVVATRKELRKLDESVASIGRERAESQSSVKQRREKLQQAKRKQERARDELIQLEEDMRADEPANMAALEEARREAREELERCRESFAAVQARKEDVEMKTRPKQERYDELRKLIDDAEQDSGALRHELQKVVEQRVQCTQELKTRNISLEKVTAELTALEADAEDKRLDYESAEEQALEYTENERVEATQSHEFYEREIEACEKLIAAARKQSGGTPEEVMAEFRQRQKAYDEAKSEIDEMKLAITGFFNALQKRLQMWQDFRRSISLRARAFFNFHLSKRGYTGSLHFNHNQQKLQIKVQTEDTMSVRASGAGGGSRNKDPRSLSGGEKSFSTICLLLSLWEAIGCPIRCLDEFDVFMDAINRRISMKMITDTAKTSHNVQYILITPQNMGNIKFGPEVRVQKLSDPERRQAALPFGT